MIPSIEDILSDLMNIRITFKQALAWIQQHIELGQENADLRDHFAAAAMQGLLAADVKFTISASDISSSAYLHADAMLKARVQ